MNSEKLKFIDSLTIRPSEEADLGAIQAIYAIAVQQGTGTFETEAPSLDEMARRRAEVLGRNLPWLVAEAGGQVLGYAYANYFRPRLAYRFCLEDSIYLHPQSQGKGLGKLLLAELIARCEQQGARQMLAVIGDADNQGSIGIHRSLGFAHTGVLKSAGWKFGRWLDVVMMQRELGQGAQCNPEGNPEGNPA
ncbi:N-acetyltransferase family protein [Paucibacter sp. B2R-40]|uniref:GNAT family N-acetyltransferase n=1 Tax=Paucibacter sp. B2R-40 TaxID=2893554 RepID=UPI0021E4B9D7|nr:GNAT family N-acetyltransferase [Paucibacter sp. B2R-40]MCV2353916.1 N-acetyltransferase family protein [Paucibacter sp. B2R-40]